MSVHITRFRTADPFTSKAGAAHVAGRAPTQAMRLLMAYEFSNRGCTDEEAAEYAVLLQSCYWKRCGELRADGLIEPVKIMGTQFTRKGRAGTARIVCRLTPEGRKVLQQKGLA